MRAGTLTGWQAPGRLGTPAWRVAGLRQARGADLPAILALHADAWRRLATAFYTPAQIEAFLAQGTMDPSLIDTGRYCVIDQQSTLLACAGWCPDDTRRECPPRGLVRAVYVHPDWSRRGLGSQLMAHVHTMARQAGCRSLRLTASLTGVPLYLKMGYAETARDPLHLPGGLALPVRHMVRSLE